MHCNCFQQDQISKLEKMFDSILKEKSLFEKELGNTYMKNPENQEIKIFVEKYESIFKEKPIWAQSCRDNPGKRTDVPGTLVAKFDPGSTEDYGNEGARIMGVSDELNEDDARVDTNVLNQLKSHESESLKKSEFEKPDMDVSGCRKTDEDSQ